MADLIDPGNFEFFARYFLAGFILYSVRSLYVLGERPKATETVFEAVVFSLLNQLTFLLFSPSVSWLFSLFPNWLNAAVGTLLGGRTAFFLEVLVLPACLGVAFGLALRQGWSSAILRKLAMPFVHPTRRAYDHAFGINRPGSFVIVTYEDGTAIHGYFGQNSLAASDAERSDLYLEQLYDVKDGNWTASVSGKSALVTLRNMRSIEFVPVRKESQR